MHSDSAGEFTAATGPNQPHSSFAFSKRKFNSFFCSFKSDCFAQFTWLQSTDNVLLVLHESSRHWFAETGRM